MIELNVAGIKVTCEEAVLPMGITLESVLTCKPFTDWLAELDQERFTVKSVQIQAVNMFGPRVGFLMFKADVCDSIGRALPGVVFMRGGCVAILPVLLCNGRKYTALTVQPRLPTGKFDFVEIPAGMLDGSGNFVGVAAKEIEEELGMKISNEELIDMSEMAGHTDGHFPSPGGSDETIRMFCFVRNVSEEELADFNGRLTGNLEEGEQITLKIVPIESLWRIPDGKTLVAHALFRELESEILG